VRQTHPLFAAFPGSLMLTKLRSAYCLGECQVGREQGQRRQQSELR
jgi:hypothetical protein